MTEINITKARALELLTDVVKDMGAEYVYNRTDKGCVYTDGERPSCIVGHALARAGVPFDVLKAIDFGGAVRLTTYDEKSEKWLEEPIEVPVETGLEDTGIFESEVTYWLGKNDVHLDAGALDLLGAAQGYQDSGIPWGEAVTKSIGKLTNGRI